MKRKKDRNCLFKEKTCPQEHKQTSLLLFSEVNFCEKKEKRRKKYSFPKKKSLKRKCKGKGEKSEKRERDDFPKKEELKKRVWSKTEKKERQIQCIWFSKEEKGDKKEKVLFSKINFLGKGKKRKISGFPKKKGGKKEKVLFS